MTQTIDQDSNKVDEIDRLKDQIVYLEEKIDAVEIRLFDKIEQLSEQIYEMQHR